MEKHLTRREFLGQTAALAAGAAAVSIIGCRRLGAPDSDARDGADGRGEQTDGAALPRRPLGQTGERVTLLGLGGAGFLSESTDEEAVGAILEAAWDAGIRYFDTAHNYGNGRSETNLGLLMGTPRRREAFLATKCEARDRDGALRQVETSLRRLRVDRIDLIQVHHVCPRDTVADFGRPDGVLPALRRLRDEKVVRFIGVTGHPNYPQVLQALERYEWDTFMGFVNPADFCDPFFRQQLPVARKKGMGIIAMKTLGGERGKLVGSAPGRAGPAALLRYAASQPISTAIPAVASVEQVRQNAAALRGFRAMSGREQEALKAQINAPDPGWREAHDDTDPQRRVFVA